MKLSKQNNVNVEVMYNNLRSKLKVVTNKSIVPSNDYKFDLLKEKTNLSMTRKDILSTLSEVRLFKEEFSKEFNDNLDTNEFYNYYSEIESIENKLLKEEEKSNILDKKIDSTILENDKRIREIEKLDKEKKKKEKEEKIKKEEEKKVQNQNKNSMNNTINNNQMYMNYDMYNMDMDYEEERTRGRSR